MLATMADDSLLISDTLRSTVAETQGQTDYAGAGESAEDLEYALTELDRHAPGYQVAKLYAAGLSPELFFLSEQARRDVIAFIDGFRFNFAGLVVETIADRMIINAIDGIESTDLDTVVMRSNKFYTWSAEAISDMLTCGDHYIISLPGDGEDSDPVMIPGDAVDTRLFYDSETDRTPVMGIRRWAVGRGKQASVRANLWYPDRVERFIRPPDARWQRYSDETAGLLDVEPQDFIPFAHMRTRTPYGRPIHANAYGPQDAIVKAIMTLMASTEFTGWPQRYALHEENMIGQTGLPNRSAAANTTTGIAPKARLRSGPGTVWDVFAKSVGAFEAADLTKLIEVVDLAVRGMSQVTRIPMHYFDPAGGFPSGESLLAADQPVKASANRQRGNAGAGLREAVIQTGLHIGVQADPEIVWAPDPVISDQTWWETARVKRESGVPQRQILMEAGYTPDQIDEFEAENARNAPQDVPPTVPLEPGDPNQPPEE